MHRILVLGAGFAGLWSAVAAARRLDELGAGPDEVEVTTETENTRSYQGGVWLGDLDSNQD